MVQRGPSKASCVCGVYLCLMASDRYHGKLSQVPMNWFGQGEY